MKVPCLNAVSRQVSEEFKNNDLEETKQKSGFCPLIRWFDIRNSHSANKTLDDVSRMKNIEVAVWQ